MKTIIDTLKYDGGPVEAHKLYTQGEDLVLEGTVHFRSFGKVKMNGVQVDNSEMRVRLVKPTVFQIMKDAAILFMEAPRLVREIEAPLPVPEPPEYQDEMTIQMRQMFQAWAKDMGLVSGGVGGPPPTAEEADDDWPEGDNYEEWEDLEIDRDSLIPEDQTTNDLPDYDELEPDESRDATTSPDVDGGSARVEASEEENPEGFSESETQRQRVRSVS